MRIIAAVAIVFLFVLGAAIGANRSPQVEVTRVTSVGTDATGRDGQAIFRYDTFGDERLWTDVLRMHEVVAPVPPATALAVGLKVDVEALPAPWSTR